MRMSEEDFIELQKRMGKAPPEEPVKKKESKYGSKRTLVDGMYFDSVLESNYYNDLKLLLMAGEIAGFGRQPQFILQEGFGVVKPTSYYADFIVFNLDGTVEIIDTKGFLTDVYELKNKMFAYKFPKLTIKEVRKY